MRSRARFTIAFSLVLAFAVAMSGFRFMPTAEAAFGEVTIETVTHYAGNTDVYTNRKNRCIKVKRKSTGETWTGTTDDLGRLVINTGTVVGKDDLEASEAEGCGEQKSSDSATLEGYVTTAIDTDRGKIKLNSPADVRPGDQISVTAEAANGGTVSGIVYEVGERQKTSSDNRVLKFVVPAAVGAFLPIILKDHSGRRVGEGQIKINHVKSIVPSHPQGDRPIVPPRTDVKLQPPPVPLDRFDAPRIGQTGGSISIVGDLDGDLGTTQVKVGGTSLNPIAESPRCTVFGLPENLPAGPSKISIEENGVREEEDFNPLKVNFWLDDPSLRLRQSTQAHLEISGMEGLVEDQAELILNIKNVASHVVSTKPNGNVPRRDYNYDAAGNLVRRIDPSTVKGGIFRENYTLTGIGLGQFLLRATVRLFEPTTPRDWLRELWKDKLSASKTSGNSKNKEALAENARRVKKILEDDDNWDAAGDPKDKKKFADFLNDEMKKLEEMYKKESDENTKEKIQEAIDDIIEAADAAGLDLQ